VIGLRADKREIDLCACAECVTEFRQGEAACLRGRNTQRVGIDPAILLSGKVRDRRLRETLQG